MKWATKLKPLFTDRKILIVFLLGISSGLPLLLTLGTLQAWCKDAGMSLSDIGLLAAVGTPYTLKFLWSPILDWFVPPFLGRRRGWLLISQLMVIGALLGLATANPGGNATVFALWALLVAFTSATQDIVIDAYQIEILPPEQYGLGNQFYILGYRIGMIVASSGALILADHISWWGVYTAMAGCMGIGLFTTFIAKEPNVTAKAPRTFAEAVWHPIKDFFSPNGSLQGKAMWILAFFLLYNIGANMATALTTPYYMELGFSKTQIGAIAKTFGLTATIVGGLIGGLFVVSLGVRKCLWIFGVIQGLGYLSFAWLGQYVATTGSADTTALATAISVENLGVGLATAAYASFMGSVVNRKFTATQYALLSSLMGVTRVYSGVPTGYLVEAMGWPTFFMFCSLMTIPGLFILWMMEKNGDAPSPQLQVS